MLKLSEALFASLSLAKLVELDANETEPVVTSLVLVMTVLLLLITLVNGLLFTAMLAF